MPKSSSVRSPESSPDVERQRRDRGVKGASVETIRRRLLLCRLGERPTAPRRGIRLESIVMDRHQTRLDARELETGERRQFRLDRITRAGVENGLTLTVDRALVQREPFAGEAVHAACVRVLLSR